MKYILSILALSLLFVVQASEIRKVTGIYVEMVDETTMTIEEAKRNALEKAKINALEEAGFSTIVTQSTSSILYNKNETSHSFFGSYLGSLIKGEWETIGKPKYDIWVEDGKTFLRCEVSGKAKERRGNDLEIEVLPLRNYPEKRSKSTVFSSGDDLYMYFKSPVSGFLNVFLVCNDEDTAYCLLPYKESSGTSFKIKADKEYIFFSKKKSEEKTEKVDEYQLTASRLREYNDLVVIFSIGEFNKTTLETRTEEEIPKSLTIKKFLQYLSKVKAYSDDAYVIPIQLTISNDEI